MNLVLEPEMRSQDAKIVIAAMLGSADTQRLAWELLQARWDEVQKKTGEFVGNTVIVGGLSAGVRRCDYHQAGIYGIH